MIIIFLLTPCNQNSTAKLLLFIPIFVTDGWAD